MQQNAVDGGHAIKGHFAAREVTTLKTLEAAQIEKLMVKSNIFQFQRFCLQWI